MQVKVVRILLSAVCGEDQRAGATKPAYRTTTATAAKAAVSAAPRPARALPTAATATPSTISALPSGRLRNVAAATTTTASVPRLLAAIATSRAGRKSR